VVDEAEDQALLIAIPLHHLESVEGQAGECVVLPAGGPGDLDAAAAGTPVLVMPTTVDDSGISAATWGATFVRRVPYQPGSPWPEGLPASWTAEHPAPPPAPEAVGPVDLSDEDEDDWDEDDRDEDDWDEDDDEDEGLQSFLEVTELRPLPRREWVFANELVPKQARGGRHFQPRVPVLVPLPD
jgi:hypothetical protein